MIWKKYKKKFNNFVPLCCWKNVLTIVLFAECTYSRKLAYGQKEKKKLYRDINCISKVVKRMMIK